MKTTILKYYLRSSFDLNTHTFGFNPQTQKTKLFSLLKALEYVSVKLGAAQ